MTLVTAVKAMLVLVPFVSRFLNLTDPAHRDVKEALVAGAAFTGAVLAGTASKREALNALKETNDCLVRLFVLLPDPPDGLDVAERDRIDRILRDA